MRARLIGLLCLGLVAVGAGVGAGTAAFADGGPVVTDVRPPATPVVDYGSYAGVPLVVTADVVPGAHPLAASDPVILSLSAAHPRTTAAGLWLNSVAAVDMTSTDGEHFTATVLLARNANPGAWLASVTATDSTGATGTQSATFEVVLNTLLTAAFTPPAFTPTELHETVTYYGTLRSMQPRAVDPGTAHGLYVPYPGKTLTIDVAGHEATVTTDSTGAYRYSTTVGVGDAASVSFAGTIYHRAASLSLPGPSVVEETSRFTDVKITPNPMYRNAFVTLSGTLQAHDPFTKEWLPIPNAAVEVVRPAPVFLGWNVVTDAYGHFSLRLHGPTVAIAGEWGANFSETGAYYDTSATIGVASTMTAPMRITKIVYNPPGNDEPPTVSQLDAEDVTVTDEGNHDANLLDWTLRDAAGHVYTIDHSVYVQPGHSVTIHTGTGTDTTTQLYWNQPNYIWNNDGDTADLRNDRDEPVDSCSWTSNGTGSTNC